MNKTFPIVIVVIAIAILGIAGLIIHGSQIPKNNQNLNQSVLSWLENKSDLIGISFEYPSTWYLDNSNARTGFASVSSTASLNLTYSKNTGKIDLNTSRTNPKLLTPRQWVDATFADQRTEIKDEKELAIGTYSAYEFTVNELQTRRHVFLFHDSQVVEVAYPVNQAAYQDIYNHVLNSIKITAPAS